MEKPEKSETSEAGATGGSTSAPDGIHLQLVPVADESGGRPIGEVVDRTLKEGTPLRIGRQVVKEGQTITPQPKHGISPAKAGDQDIWFMSKVVSRNHAEVWIKDGEVYVKDIGSSSGTWLNQMRLSPSGKESRPYTLRDGDTLRFGADFRDKPQDIYKSVNLRVTLVNASQIMVQRRKANPQRFQTALKSLLAATNPYASADSKEDAEGSTDCCICLGSIGPYQALFIAPCSHCYHYKCVREILERTQMFQCPLCRQVANLTASVSMESLFDTGDSDEEGEKEKAPSSETPRKMGQLRSEPGSAKVDGNGAGTPLNPDAGRPTTELQQSLIRTLERLQESDKHSGIETPGRGGASTPLPEVSSITSATPLLPPTTTSPPPGRRSRRNTGDSTHTSHNATSSPSQPRPKRRPSISSKIGALLGRRQASASNTGTGSTAQSPLVSPGNSGDIDSSNSAQPSIIGDSSTEDTTGGATVLHLKTAELGDEGLGKSPMGGTYSEASVLQGAASVEDGLGSASGAGGGRDERRNVPV
ncbi:hypothetical protein HDV00_004646 [Rhizophlyctis rosea]|nr:hypothetical protein HDV00_004646 [Rhizophlyctis rosea]